MATVYATRYADHWETPNRKHNVRGTVCVTKFPNGGGNARVTHPFDFDQAVVHYDPFQTRSSR